MEQLSAIRRDAHEHATAMVDQLAELVACESPPGSIPQLKSCGDLLAGWGQEVLGRKAEWAVRDGLPHLLWPAQDQRVLLLGHFDTVWPAGTIEQWPFSVTAGIASGPGVCDMKGGIVQMFTALRLMADTSKVGVLLTCDEESGSVTSRELIEREARRSGAVLVCEPSSPDGALKVARKGGSAYRLMARGRAAHAGVEPHKGVNATMEIAHQILAVRPLADTSAGTSVTPTVVAGGTTSNTVPEAASVCIDVRSWTRDELDRVDLAIRGLTPRLPEAELTLGGGINRYPLLPEVALPLLEVARAAAADIGVQPPEGAHAPGASDGNFTGALGVPTLDGLGVVGGGSHARSEYADVTMMPDRAALLAALAGRLLTRTPGRLPGPPALLCVPGRSPRPREASVRGIGMSSRFGVEEEFLVVDPVTRAAVPRAEAVLNRAKATLDARVSGEITKLQLETKTLPCHSAAELLGQLLDARQVLSSAAEAEGLRIVATGTPVLGQVVPPPITEGPRQDRGMATFRGLHDEQSICAMHVHVEVPDRERAVLVSNHLRPYLPTIIALAANSPYWAERDTGYASWRTVTWGRWPVAGPPPYFTSAAHYDELVGVLLEAGGLVDKGTIFWDIRPSARYPTLEIRAADVPMTAQESALLAALVRALVTCVTSAVDRGDPGPVIPGELMRLAYWRAARDGLDGDGIDVYTGRLVPAAELAEGLFRTARPALEENGDLDLVAGWLGKLTGNGSGAARQRRAAGRHGTLTDVVDHLIVQSASRP